MALEYVERVRNSPCTGGTEEVLPVTFDHSMWSQYADVAVRMSNTLTKLVIRNNNRQGHLVYPANTVLIYRRPVTLKQHGLIVGPHLL